MNKLLWILTGATAGIAAYILLKDPTSPAYTSGTRSGDVGGGLRDVNDNLRAGASRLAGKVDRWGTGQNVSGKLGKVGGSIKEGVGDLTGDADLQDRGVGDQAVGAVKDAAGKVAHAVSDTIHDLNK